MSMIRHLITALLTVAPFSVVAQQIDAERVGNRLDVTVDWEAFNNQLNGSFQQPLVADRCGTTAEVVQSDAMAGSDGDAATVRVTLDVNRHQCAETQRLKCRGLNCKPTKYVSQTKLFSKRVVAELDMVPTTHSRDGAPQIRFVATPESSESFQRQLFSDLPDYDRIETLLVKRIAESMESSVEPAVKNAFAPRSPSITVPHMTPPVPAPTRNPAYITGKPLAGSDSLKFTIRRQ